MRRRAFQITPAEKQKIVKLREMGITLTNIGCRFGLSRTAIKKIIRQFCVEQVRVEHVGVDRVAVEHQRSA